MVKASDIAVRAAFRLRMQEIKDDIAAGRIKFSNSPPEWTEHLLEITALNWVMWVLAQEAKWN